MLLGAWVTWPQTPAEKTVAAFAPMVQTEGSAAAPTLAPTPANTMENWFALDGVATLAPSFVSSEFSAPTTPAPTPAPSETGGFLIELVREEGGEQADGQSPVKRALIYHTHTYEAYEQTPANPYKETQQWRTQDNQHNIVRVGEELASLLRSMGVEVVHDTSDFEPPNLTTAYSRSLSMLEQRKAQGESYDLYIDLHRDAYVEGQAGPNAIQVGDHSVARLMLLIGKGEGQTDEGFDEKPPWQDNLLIAQRITDSLNAQVAGLGKDVRIKAGRFNQHIAVGCVLVEVGNNLNTLEEAVAAMPYLADAIDDTLLNGK